MNLRYKTPLRPSWFMDKPGFRLFMLREATSLFMAGYLIFLLVWLRRLGQGPEAYATFLESLRHPVPILLHLVALAASLYHSITWFNLTPKIMPMYLGEDRLPDKLAAVAMGFGPWIVLSGIILWGVLR